MPQVPSQAEFDALVRRVIALEDEAPPPPPDPDPAPPPGTEPADIKWLHTDVSQWPQTSRITAVSFSATALDIKHTKAGRWPTIDIGTASKPVVIEGNPWVIAFVDGEWHAATYEWLRPGQTKKGITAQNIGPHIKRAPLDRWVPKQGETVFFMISTPARDSRRSDVQERSQMVEVRWGVNWRA
jgi:hypothetical protein